MKHSYGSNLRWHESPLPPAFPVFLMLRMKEMPGLYPSWIAGVLSTLSLSQFWWVSTFVTIWFDLSNNSLGVSLRRPLVETSAENVGAIGQASGQMFKVSQSWLSSGHANSLPRESERVRWRQRNEWMESLVLIKNISCHVNSLSNIIKKIKSFVRHVPGFLW